MKLSQTFLEYIFKQHTHGRYICIRVHVFDFFDVPAEKAVFYYSTKNRNVTDQCKPVAQ